MGKIQRRGKRNIKEKKRGVHSGKKITGEQAAEVRRLIKDKCPEQLKLPFGLWTRQAVEQLILERYGVKLSTWQVGRYAKIISKSPVKMRIGEFTGNHPGTTFIKYDF